MSYLTHLQCSKCRKEFDPDRVWNLCPVCEKPLISLYDLKKISRSLDRRDLLSRPSTLWRYRELLPVRDTNILSLGEGFTPLIHATNLGGALGFDNLFVKDEGLNPTGSFKARGMSVALSRAKELGVKEVSIPSAGNAAGALSAYASLGNLKAYVFMPVDVPELFVLECKMFGAEVQFVEGVITNCGQASARGVREYGRFDMSTLKEPYRIEGKKTMGLELAEQMGWKLPDVIIYPTGGGTGLIGMWKAFEELRRLGWIDAKLPRMVTVQAEGCAPIVEAFKAGEDHAKPWPHWPKTIAEGLRVPKAIGDFLILRALRESNGTAITVSDDEIMDSIAFISQTQGIFCCPEGAATLAAFKKLRGQDWIRGDESVVLFNTATGLKYTHLWEKQA